MKTITPIRFRKINLILMTILLVSSPVFGDPYIQDCSSGDCIYLNAGSSIWTCELENAELWAVNPDTSLNLEAASFQWWVWVRGNSSNGWQDQWTEAIGGTGNRLEVTDTERFKYKCEVTTTGDFWTTSSTYVNYTANDVAIGSAPEDEIVCPGNLIELYSTGSGSHATKQWETKRPGEDWGALTGENTEYYTFTASLSDDGSQFRYRVSNECASTASRAAEISIHNVPELTGNITNASKCEGTTATYSVSASGSEISYQWRRSVDNGENWSDIINEGNYIASLNNLSISGLEPSMDQDIFKCVVSGICGFTTPSDSGRLTIFQKPYLIRHPERLTKCLGEKVVLHARGGGTEPITYEWRKAGVSVSNQSTDTSFIIPQAAALHAGSYLVRLTNQCTSVPVPSDEASLMVKLPPSITNQPGNQGFCEGTVQNTKYTVDVQGDELEYSWQLSRDAGTTWANINDTAAYTGSASFTLNIQDAGSDHSGLLYRCQISGICGDQVSSDPAILSVKTGPQIINPPANKSACLKDEVTFHVNASGSKPLLYQWKANNQSVTDWISDSDYKISSVNFSDAKDYNVLVKNECNLVGLASDAAELTINAVPIIDLGDDIHVCEGGEAQLNAGSGYTKYAWSTGDTLQEIGVSTQQTVEVQVWNSYNCSGKDVINIIIDPAIPALDLGADMAFCQGEETILDAGDQYDNYIWNNESGDQSISVKSSGSYMVTAGRNNSVCLVSDTIDIHFNQPFNNDNICLITTDLATGYNLIVWEKTQEMGTAAYHIYRQTGIINQYDIIGTVPYDELSIFKDTVADPEQRQWVYKITAVDTCSNESDISDAIYHIPMFLQYQSSVDGVNLKWEKYEVENSSMDFVSYEIYRGTDSTSLNKINTLSSDLNVYRDNDPNALTFRYFYRIAGVRAEPCYPSDAKKAGTGPYSHSLSNMEDNKLKTTTSANSPMEINPLDIYPNPMQEFATIRFSNPDQSEYLLTIRDFSGKIVKVAGSIRHDEIMIYRENLVQGYYIVEISGNRLFRGKLIVQ